MIQYRFGLFFAAATVVGVFLGFQYHWLNELVQSGALSGLLAYGISFMAGTHGLEGWSWIFVSLPTASQEQLKYWHIG